MIGAMLLYIAFALPFSLGFLGGEETPVDVVMNYIFLADCALNFRTGYTDSDGLEVLDWRKVTRNYLRTWFCLDFFSSLPLEDIVAAFASDAANVPSPQPAKMLKIGKVAKVLKVLKFGQLIQSFGENSDFA